MESKINTHTRRVSSNKYSMSVIFQQSDRSLEVKVTYERRGDLVAVEHVAVLGHVA
jgi:hypothetical protein